MSRAALLRGWFGGADLVCTRRVGCGLHCKRAPLGQGRLDVGGTYAGMEWLALVDGRRWSPFDGAVSGRHFLANEPSN
jgi:hypothetical protein